LQALNSVLKSIESVRNGRALYVLLLTFAVSGLLLGMAQSALARGTALQAALWVGAAFFSVFYGTSAAGLVVMDEAMGRPRRHPFDALRDALGLGHRLLLVVLVVLLWALLPVAAVAGLLQAARLPGVGETVMSVTVALAVPALGLMALILVALVGPLAAPAVWSGMGVRATLALIVRQVRGRLAHAVLLSAAVSLLTAAVAGLVSFVVLAGGRAVLALAVSLAELDLAAQPFLAALFGTGLRLSPGAAAPSALTAAAVSGAGFVFALGLVVPGVVYLRGLCELFIALRALDEGEAEAAHPLPRPPPAP
jgi:hypothetical protein